MQNSQVLDLCEADEEVDTSCQKDTGQKSKLHMWSRGRFFIVRPCGHIDQWQPLYRYVLNLNQLNLYLCILDIFY